MKNTDTDFTGLVGAIHSSVEWPMFSFNSVAFSFWNGFCNGLLERGLTMEQIKDQLQSKGMRWMLDEKDEAIENLGRKFAKNYNLLNL